METIHGQTTTRRGGPDLRARAVVAVARRPCAGGIALTRVREADPADRAAVRNVIDGANLELSPETLVSALDRDGALVALADEEQTVIGALVLDDERIAAVAVRPGRRAQGIGTALVEAALDRRGRLVADFDPAVEPFWQSLGFEIDRRGDGRRRGVR